jgi:hypothetical protein
MRRLISGRSGKVVAVTGGVAIQADAFGVRSTAIAPSLA